MFVSSALAIAAAAVSTSAFSPQGSHQHHQQHQRGRDLSEIDHLSYQNQPNMMQPPETVFQPEFDIANAYDRAADCANNFGLCPIGELLDLSEELDEYIGCFVEDGPEACEGEINDRQQLSDALLGQGEMREHERLMRESMLENSFENSFEYDYPPPMHQENVFDIPAYDVAARDMDRVNNAGSVNGQQTNTQPRTSVWKKNGGSEHEIGGDGGAAAGDWALGP